jgi:aspartate racemase
MHLDSLAISMNFQEKCQIAIPGIVGGLGPLAHIQFEQILLESSRSRGNKRDQDHPEWVLVSATQVPDRTQSIQGKVPDCSTFLVKYGRRLEKAGADFLIVTCNTAHAFYDVVQAQLSLPWIPLMECTTRTIVKQFPNIRKVGILATDGTLQTQLYQQSLRRAGLSPISPEIFSAEQVRIMKAIYHPQWGIKTGGVQVSKQAIDELAIAIAWLKEQGAEVVIAGCTEISVGLTQIPFLPLPWVDPLKAIAETTLDLAYGVHPIASLSTAK